MSGSILKCQGPNPNTLFCAALGYAEAAEYKDLLAPICILASLGTADPYFTIRVYWHC